MSQYDDLYELEDKPKRKRDEDPTTWADAWKAIGIFAGLALVLSIILMLVQWVILGDTIPRYTEMSIATSADLMQFDYFSNRTSGLQNPNYPTMIAGTVGLSLVSIILLVIGLFMIYGLIHVFTTKVQGGEGTLRGLIVRSCWWTTGVYVVYLVLNTITSSIMIINIVNRFEGVDITASLAVLEEYNEFIISQSGLTVSILLLAWLVWCVSIGFVTAQNYQINKSNGCVAVLLTNVTLIALYCGCAFAVGFGLAGYMLSAS